VVKDTGTKEIFDLANFIDFPMAQGEMQSSEPNNPTVDTESVSGNDTSSHERSVHGEFAILPSSTKHKINLRSIETFTDSVDICESSSSDIDITISDEDVYSPYRYAGIPISCLNGNKLKVLPDDFGWEDYRSAMHDDERRRDTLSMGRSLWPSLGKFTIAMTLNCSCFLLLENERGYWLARANFCQIGFLSNEWAEVSAKVAILDTLATHLTDTVPWDAVDTL
jgi:hypothetical protein